LAGFGVSQLGVGLTLPFLIIYLHDVRGIELSIISDSAWAPRSAERSSSRSRPALSKRFS